MVDPNGITWSWTGPLPEREPDPVSAIRWLWSMTPDPDEADARARWVNWNRTKLVGMLAVPDGDNRRSGR